LARSTAWTTLALPIRGLRCRGEEVGLSCGLSSRPVIELQRFIEQSAGEQTASRLSISVVTPPTSPVCTEVDELGASLEVGGLEVRQPRNTRTASWDGVGMEDCAEANVEEDEGGAGEEDQARR